MGGCSAKASCRSAHDAVYAPVAPCTTHMNMEIYNEGQGLDPLYDQGLYLDEQAALHLDHNDGGQTHEVVGGGNIDDQLGDIQDGLTLDSLSRRQFMDAEYEARVSSLNESQRVLYEKIVI